MAKIEKAGEDTWKFWCPGCDSAHMVSNSWQVDPEVGTISPSVLVYETSIHPRCHSFVTDGQIQYLSDSTHALAGQTVEVPDWIDALDEHRGQ